MHTPEIINNVKRRINADFYQVFVVTGWRQRAKLKDKDNSLLSFYQIIQWNILFKTSQNLTCLKSQEMKAKKGAKIAFFNLSKCGLDWCNWQKIENIFLWNNFLSSLGHLSDNISIYCEQKYIIITSADLYHLWFLVKIKGSNGTCQGLEFFLFDNLLECLISC